MQRHGHPGAPSHCTSSTGATSEPFTPTALGAAGLTLVVALAACASPPAGPPQLVFITPTRAAEGVATAVELGGERFFARVVTDFTNARSSTVEGSVSASLVDGTGAAFPLEDVALVDQGRVVASVSSTTPRGIYDVAVTDGRGQTATLPAAFSVVTPADAVLRFLVEPVPAQHPRVPFGVRVTALGERDLVVDSFSGTVRLRGAVGTASPATSASFARGRLQDLVEVDTLTEAEALVVDDGAGHTGQSEPFAVRPGPASSMTLSGGPPSAAAGACVGPFTLRSLDVFGFGALPTQPVTVALSAVPGRGVTFFSDAACAAAVPDVGLGPDAGVAVFFVSATVAGPVSLRATPATLPSAQGSLVVAPLAPVGLVFTRAPGAVASGACSSAFELVAVDAHGNAAPPGAPTGLALTPAPAAGVSLWSDGTCTTPLSPPSLGPGVASRRFFIAASVPGPQRLTATVDGGVALSSARIDLEVTP